MASEETKRRTKKKKRSTTKFIMFLMMLITVVVVTFSIWFTWMLKDATIIVTLIPCVFVETATCTGFYFWRRKVDAMINYKIEYGEQFMEDTFDDV